MMIGTESRVAVMCARSRKWKTRSISSFLWALMKHSYLKRDFSIRLSMAWNKSSLQKRQRRIQRNSGWRVDQSSRSLLIPPTGNRFQQQMQLRPARTSADRNIGWRGQEIGDASTLDIKTSAQLFRFETEVELPIQLRGAKLFVVLRTPAAWWRRCSDLNWWLYLQ